MDKWKQLSCREHTVNKYWTYKIDEYYIPGADHYGEYHYIHTNGSTMVVPVNEDNKIILLNQYRYLLDRDSIELPCGGISAGYEAVENADKELREETGFGARKYKYAGYFAPFNGVSDELCHVFIAEDLYPAPLKPDKTEEFELIAATFDEVEKMIADNTIWDGMTVAAWNLAKAKLTSG